MSELGTIFAILSGVFIYDRYHCAPEGRVWSSLFCASHALAAVICGVIGAIR